MTARLALTSLRRQANLITYVQISFVLIVALVFLFVQSPRAAMAVILGGAVYIVPSYMYAIRLLGNVSPRSVMRIMLVFYLGEALKLLVSVGLFIVFFYAFSLPLLPYFLGYFMGTLAFCLAPVLFVNRINSFSS